VNIEGRVISFKLKMRGYASPNTFICKVKDIQTGQKRKSKFQTNLSKTLKTTIIFTYLQYISKNIEKILK